MSKQVERIKETCWKECLEVTVPEATWVLFQRINFFHSERDPGHEVSHMQKGFIEADELGAKLFDSIDIST